MPVREHDLTPEQLQTGQLYPRRKGHEKLLEKLITEDGFNKIMEECRKSFFRILPPYIEKMTLLCALFYGICSLRRFCLSWQQGRGKEMECMLVTKIVGPALNVIVPSTGSLRNS